ncbi:MAG: gamma-glutamyl-gamma-aminobutyrate hydrolase family protein [Anaerolineales bacterium]|nr:gamma-glutamyl-gamma-aminobutyrate hydrolase family protein [Anaerolineales bacterium]
MLKPLIGLTAERWSSGYLPLPDQDVQGVLRTYVEALRGAGALPVIIPLGLTEEDRQALAARLDGLLLPGGGDVDPAAYGEAPHPKLSDDVDPLRDALEIGLARDAVASGLPLLAVCRGIQVLNVALGGTLIQDIPSQVPGAVRHSFFLRDAPREHLAHAVQVAEGSRLADVLGTPIVRVNSRHHQAVRDVASGLEVVAHAPDGVIEGVELPGHPFLLGVQWHPENLQALPEMKRLFVGFVEAAANGKREERGGRSE